MQLDLLKSTETLCLLRSNAAKYMVAAGATLTSVYPKLIHVTCVVHLLRNCARKVKFHFQDADQLIAKVKSATNENNI